MPSENSPKAKSKAFREQSATELTETVKDLRKTLFDHQFKHGTRQLSDTSVLSRTKRDIARAETVLREQFLRASVPDASVPDAGVPNEG